MGALSSCCSVEESKDKINIQDGKSTDQNKASHNAGEIANFRNKLKKGANIIVLLQDGTKLPCSLCLNTEDKALSISCEDKVRVIPIHDIRQLLETKEQLWRVETKANLLDDPNCIALHLSESGNCIPIRFETLEEKMLFSEVVNDFKNNNS